MVQLSTPNTSAMRMMTTTLLLSLLCTLSSSISTATTTHTTTAAASDGDPTFATSPTWLKQNLCGGSSSSVDSSDSTLFCRTLMGETSSESVFSKQYFVSMISELKNRFLRQLHNGEWDTELGIQHDEIVNIVNGEEARQQLITKKREEAISGGGSHQVGGGIPKNAPFFDFLPVPVGNVTTKKSLTFDAPAMHNIQLEVSKDNIHEHMYTISVNVPNISKTGAVTTLVVWGGRLALKLIKVDQVGLHKFPFNVTEGVTGHPGDAAYLSRFGFQVTRTPKPVGEMIPAILATVTLLEGYTQAPLPPAVAAESLEFIRDYIQYSPKRMGPKAEAFPQYMNTVAKKLDPNYIQSGDVLMLRRNDGLDPMIGWGEGFTAGHSTIAMRNASGLYVCESTTLDSYWPTNGVQCHKWEEWIELCTKAEQNVLLVPLSPHYSKKFDSDKAWEFFRGHEGVDYGFQTFLFGWLDTATKNFPCTPTGSCLSTQAADLVFFAADAFQGNHPRNIVRQAMAHRAELPGHMPLTEQLLHWANRFNVKGNEALLPKLYTIPEQDSWLYHTLKDNNTEVLSKSMVCCVFVCNMLKTAGVFAEIGSENIQCGEQTLWDLFSMNIYDSNKMNDKRPAVCQQSDNNNTLCQLMGSTTFVGKPDLNTRPLYAHMGEKCSSVWPDYMREPGC